MTPSAEPPYPQRVPSKPFQVVLTGKPGGPGSPGWPCRNNGNSSETGISRVPAPLYLSPSQMLALGCSH
jgi:hypothetical protein